MQVLHCNGDEDYDRLLGAVQNKYFLPQHFDTQRLPLALRAAARYGLSVEDLRRQTSLISIYHLLPTEIRTSFLG